MQHELERSSCASGWVQGPPRPAYNNGSLQRMHASLPAAQSVTMQRCETSNKCVGRGGWPPALPCEPVAVARLAGADELCSGLAPWAAGLEPVLACITVMLGCAAICSSCSACWTGIWPKNACGGFPEVWRSWCKLRCCCCQAALFGGADASPCQDVCGWNSAAGWPAGCCV